MFYISTLTPHTGDEAMDHHGVPRRWVCPRPHEGGQDQRGVRGNHFERDPEGTGLSSLRGKDTQRHQR